VSNRTIQIDMIPTTSPGKFIEVSILYVARKGYVVNVQPMEKGADTVCGDSVLTSWCFTCFTNKSVLVETAPRFNAKKLAALAKDKATLEAADGLVAHICRRDGLTLAANVAPGESRVVGESQPYQRTTESA
jgi:hypothetical protein